MNSEKFDAEIQEDLKSKFIPNNEAKSARSTSLMDSSNITTTVASEADDDMKSERSVENEKESRTILLNRPNNIQKPCLCCSRRVRKYPNNEVKTSKYNFFTFLPLNLMVQFSKMANCYFLVLGLMELIKPISDAGGEPVMLVPLSFIVLVSMIKDIIEDY